jgi:peroxiredoxin
MKSEARRKIRQPCRGMIHEPRVNFPFLSSAQFPGISLQNIQDKQVSIPDRGAKFVHFQFLRFASCPVCNLHLQSFIKRDREVKAAGIHEVVVFHSPKESLLE